MTAPAREGQANAAVESLLARALGVAGGRVRILRGHASRRKLVEIRGLTDEEVLSRLGLTSATPDVPDSA